MSKPLLFTIFSCLCLVAAIPAELIAQVDQPKTPNTQASESSSQGTLSATEDPEDFRIDFAGGTIAEYVEILRRAPNFDNEMEPMPVNIVVTTSAKDFFLPPIKVTTNLTGALGLLEGCSNESSQVLLDDDPSGNVKLIRVISDERTMVTVINAKALLEKTTVDDLMEVIDVGLAMQGTTSKVELKLHQGTGLLFAKGTSSGTHLVQEIINELSGNQRGDRGVRGAGAGMGLGDGFSEDGFGAGNFGASDGGLSGGFGSGLGGNKAADEKAPNKSGGR